MPILMLALLAAAADPLAVPPAAPPAAPTPLNANDTNLAAMMPVTMALPMPPADGAIEAAAVLRWQADKAKDLRREGATGGQAAGLQP